MNPADFTENAPGDLVKVGTGDEAYWAFVPKPLPPELHFDLPLLNALADAERAVGEVEGLGRDLPNPRLLIIPLLHIEAISSSRIEGTQATLGEVYEHELELKVAGRASGQEGASSDAGEVVNYRVALEHGLSRLNDGMPVCLNVIREVHSELLSGVRGENRDPGEFRQQQVRIAGSANQDAPFVPPPVPQMTPALDAWEKYLHVEGPANYPPLVRLALIHYQFETIHPFLDGNGRTGRLLLGLLLVEWGVLTQPLLHLSEFLERYRPSYMDLLLNVSQKGAWEEWVSFFLRVVVEQSRATIARIRRLQALQKEWRQRVTKRGAPALPLELVDSLLESSVLTISDAGKRLGVSYKTAQKYVGRLVEEGILVQDGDSTYDRHFRAQGVLDAIGDA